MLELIKKWNDKVDELGKQKFMLQRDELLEEWTGRNLRGFNDIANYNKENNVVWSIKGDGKYYMKEVKTVEEVKQEPELEGQTNIDDAKVTEPKVSPKTYKKADRVQTSMYLDRELLQRLKIKGILNNITMNDIIIQLVEKYVEEE